MINIKTENTEEAKKEHYEGLKDILEKRLRRSDIKKGLSKSNLKYLDEHLEEIIKGDIEQLCSFDKEMKCKKRSKKARAAFKKSLRKIFNYDVFSKKSNDKYDAYDLASNLKIAVCPYCNIEYTTTIVTANQEKICRPAFDHYLPKSEYPLLALSFYNLIPSCTVCNSTLKGTEEFQLDKDLHPYRDHVLTDFRFSYSAIGIEDIKIKVEKREKIEGEKSLKIDKTFETFKIEERYNAHKEIAQDLIDLKRAYSEDFFSMLNKAIPSANLSPEDAYRVFIGSYPDERDFYKRPFSKLKHDVAEDLGLIKKK